MAMGNGTLGMLALMLVAVAMAGISGVGAGREERDLRGLSIEEHEAERERMQRMRPNITVINPVAEDPDAVAEMVSMISCDPTKEETESWQWLIHEFSDWGPPPDNVFVLRFNRFLKCACALPLGSG